MQILYEEEGDLKVGVVLARAPASFQVESPHGRRSKVKAANVLLAFERPPAAELLMEAKKFCADLDVEFLWQCSGSREFGFQELAREYVGRDPTPVQAARSEEHTSELQSPCNLVCRLLLEKKKKQRIMTQRPQTSE